VVHQDCSKEALWVTAHRLREVHRRAELVRAEQAKKRGPGPGCGSPAADDLSLQVRSEILSRVSACVGRDGPFDPEWDMVNSGVLSLGVCLDCGRPPAARVDDCKRALDVINRADKSSHRPAAAASPAGPLH
jgi:hypothetical protein